MIESEVRAQLAAVIETRYRAPEDGSSGAWVWLRPQRVLDYVLGEQSPESVIRAELNQATGLKDIYGLFYPPMFEPEHSLEQEIYQKMLPILEVELEKATTLKECLALTGFFLWNNSSLEAFITRVEAKVNQLALMTLNSATTLSELMDVYEPYHCREVFSEKVIRKARRMTPSFSECAEAIKRIAWHPDELKDMLINKMLDLAETPEQCKTVFEEGYLLKEHSRVEILTLQKMAKLLREK